MLGIQYLIIVPCLHFTFKKTKIAGAGESWGGEGGGGGGWNVYCSITDRCFDRISDSIYMQTFIFTCLGVLRVYHFRYHVCLCSFHRFNTGQQSLGRLSCDSTTRLRSIRPKMPLSTIQVFDLCAGSFAAISSFVWTAAELSLLLLGLSLGHHWSHQSPSRPVWALMAFTLISSL